MPFANLHSPRKDQVIYMKVIDIRVGVQACCGAVDKDPLEAAALCREMLSSSPLPSSAPRKVMGGSVEDATIRWLGDGATSVEDGAMSVEDGAIGVVEARHHLIAMPIMRRR